MRRWTGAWLLARFGGAWLLAMFGMAVLTSVLDHATAIRLGLVPAALVGALLASLYLAGRGFVRWLRRLDGVELVPVPVDAVPAAEPNRPAGGSVERAGGPVGRVGRWWRRLKRAGLFLAALPVAVAAHLLMIEVIWGAGSWHSGWATKVVALCGVGAAMHAVNRWRKFTEQRHQLEPDEEMVRSRLLR
jgi:hypothetical protein